MKSIAIYSYIDSWMAKDFVDALNDAERFKEDVKIRISTGGGSVQDGWAMLARLKEFALGKSIVVDAKAHSMGAFMCLYGDNVEAYDVASFMIHRAGYPEWYEESEHITEFEVQALDQVNDALKAKMHERLDDKVFKSVTGFTIDQVFEGKRFEILLDAKQAKKIGLISKILTLDSVAKSEVNAICKQRNIAAIYEVEAVKNVKPINNKKMTIEELKAQHPEVAASLIQEGVNASADVIAAWTEFKDVDANAVMAGIATGKAPSAADFAKFSKKMMTEAARLSAVADEAPGSAGAETPETGADKNVDAKKSGAEQMEAYLKTINK